MVWLNVTDENGSALYFIVEKVERGECRRDTGFSISGTIGDGQYEGQVLVDTGARKDVVFVDEWLGEAGFSDFKKRVDMDEVKQSIFAAAVGFRAACAGFETGALFERGDADSQSVSERPSAYLLRHHCLRVCEASDSWPAVA